MHLMCEINPDLKNDDQPIMYLRCKKALYGHIKAARLFYDDLNFTLKERLNFMQNRYDPFMYNRSDRGEKTTVRVHIDHLKISSVPKQRVLEVISQLKEVYGEITLYLGVEHDYLGMVLSYHREYRQISLNMGKYLHALIEEFERDTSMKVIFFDSCNKQSISN